MTRPLFLFEIMINLRKTHAVLLVALCSLGCIASMFHRSSLVVLMPDISTSLNLTSSEVGLLGALYLYAFALCQLPLGLLLARYGARLVMALCLALGAVGALLIGLAGHVWMAFLGRIFMGIGMSASFMGSLILLAGWFESHRFGVLSGLVAGMATLGGLMATTPLNWLTGVVGWRGVFILLAVATAVLAAFFWAIIRNPAGAAGAPNLRTSLRLLLKRVYFWIFCLASAARYGFFVAVQSTWAGPFLLWGLGLSQGETARLLLWLILGYMVGMPFSGYVSDKLKTRKFIVMAGLIGQTIVAAIMLSIDSTGPLLVLLMVGSGFFSAPGILIYAHAKETLPAQVVAPALTWINFFTIMAGGLLTQLMGHWLPANLSAIDSPTLFHPLWYAGIISVGLATLFYILLPDDKKEGAL